MKTTLKKFICCLFLLSGMVVFAAAPYYWLAPSTSAAWSSISTAAVTGKAWAYSVLQIQITSTSHGLVSGNVVTIANSSDIVNLPNGDYPVSNVISADVFEITGLGVGSGTCDWSAYCWYNAVPRATITISGPFPSSIGTKPAISDSVYICSFVSPYSPSRICNLQAHEASSSVNIGSDTSLNIGTWNLTAATKFTVESIFPNGGGKFVMGASSDSGLTSTTVSHSTSLIGSFDVQQDSIINASNFSVPNSSTIAANGHLGTIRITGDGTYAARDAFPYRFYQPEGVTTSLTNNNGAFFGTTSGGGCTILGTTVWLTNEGSLKIGAGSGKNLTIGPNAVFQGNGYRSYVDSDAISLGTESDTVVTFQRTGSAYAFTGRIENYGYGVGKYLRFPGGDFSNAHFYLPSISGNTLTIGFGPDISKFKSFTIASAGGNRTYRWDNQYNPSFVITDSIDVASGLTTGGAWSSITSTSVSTGTWFLTAGSESVSTINFRWSTAYFDPGAIEINATSQSKQLTTTLIVSRGIVIKNGDLNLKNHSATMSGGDVSVSSGGSVTMSASSFTGFQARDFYFQSGSTINAATTSRMVCSGNFTIENPATIATPSTVSLTVCCDAVTSNINTNAAPLFNLNLNGGTNVLQSNFKAGGSVTVTTRTTLNTGVYDLDITGGTIVGVGSYLVADVSSGSGISCSSFTWNYNPAISNSIDWKTNTIINIANGISMGSAAQAFATNYVGDIRFGAGKQINFNSRSTNYFWNAFIPEGTTLIGADSSNIFLTGKSSNVTTILGILRPGSASVFSVGGNAVVFGTNSDVANTSSCTLSFQSNSDTIYPSYRDPNIPFSYTGTVRNLPDTTSGYPVVCPSLNFANAPYKTTFSSGTYTIIWSSGGAVYKNIAFINGGGSRILRFRNDINNPSFVVSESVDLQSLSDPAGWGNCTYSAGTGTWTLIGNGYINGKWKQNNLPFEAVVVNAPSGSYSIVSDFAVTRSLEIISGTFDAGTCGVTVGGETIGRNGGKLTISNSITTGLRTSGLSFYSGSILEVSTGSPLFNSGNTSLSNSVVSGTIGTLTLSAVSTTTTHGFGNNTINTVYSATSAGKIFTDFTAVGTLNLAAAAIRFSTAGIFYLTSWPIANGSDIRSTVDWTNCELRVINNVTGPVTGAKFKDIYMGRKNAVNAKGSTNLGNTRGIVYKSTPR